MKTYKLITAIISYLLLFQLWPATEASCSLPCLVSKDQQFMMNTGGEVNMDESSESFFTPTPLSAMAKW